MCLIITVEDDLVMSPYSYPCIGLAWFTDKRTSYQDRRPDGDGGWRADMYSIFEDGGREGRYEHEAVNRWACEQIGPVQDEVRN